jgi:hypothetical protein
MSKRKKALLAAGIVAVLLVTGFVIGRSPRGARFETAYNDQVGTAGSTSTGGFGGRTTAQVGFGAGEAFSSGVSQSGAVATSESAKVAGVPAPFPVDKAVGAVPPPSLPSKVIKNASIEVRVAKGKFQIRFNRASSIAESLGGFVTNSSSERTGDRVASGTLTIRVPSDKFQTALAQLRALGTVTSENQNGRDVTSEYVDLEARINHARAEEAFYLKLMGQAKSIDEMLRIQDQLGQVQLQIEQLQGQKQVLDDQTTYSTISAQIFEPGVVVEPRPRKGLGRAWSEAVDGFKTIITGLIVGAGWVAPFALLLLIVIGVWKFTHRPSKKSEGGGQSG